MAERRDALAELLEQRVFPAGEVRRARHVEPHRVNGPSAEGGGGRVDGPSDQMPEVVGAFERSVGSSRRIALVGPKASATSATAPSAASSSSGETRFTVAGIHHEGRRLRDLLPAPHAVLARRLVHDVEHGRVILPLLSPSRRNEETMPRGPGTLARWRAISHASSGMTTAAIRRAVIGSPARRLQADGGRGGDAAAPVLATRSDSQSAAGRSSSRRMATGSGTARCAALSVRSSTSASLPSTAMARRRTTVGHLPSDSLAARPGRPAASTTTTRKARLAATRTRDLRNRLRGRPHDEQPPEIDPCARDGRRVERASHVNPRAPALFDGATELPGLGLRRGAREQRQRGRARQAAGRRNLDDRPARQPGLGQRPVERGDPEGERLRPRAERLLAHGDGPTFATKAGNESLGDRSHTEHVRQVSPG